MDFFSPKNFVLVSALAFALIFFAFFPQFFASIDEHTLLKNALLLREGKIAEQNPELACRSSLYTDSGYVASQFVGKSIFLIPFTFLGLSAAMLSGLVIHLLNAFIFYLILKKLGIDARFTLIYLFFPVMLWESRTLFSELLVLTGFLAAFYFYLRESRFSAVLSGFFFGLATLVRYESIFGFAAFSLPLVLSDRKKLLHMIAGLAPVAAFILLFNDFAYSGVLSSGYGAGLSILSSLASFDSMTFAVYAGILIIVFPGLLASPLFFKERKYMPQLLLLALAYLFLNSRFTNFFSFTFSVENLFTARLRYLVPLIGILLIPYSALLERALGILSSRFRLDTSKIFAALFVLCIAGAVFASSAHSKFIDSRFQTYSQIRDNVPKGALMIGSSDDCIYSMRPELSKERYINVVPGIEFAGKGPVLDLKSHLGKDTYIIDLKYSRLSGSDSVRQKVIDAERQAMADFIKENAASLHLVFETEKPNPLRIYKWEG